MSVHFKTTKAVVKAVNDNKADRSTIRDITSSPVKAQSTLADIISQTEVGQTLLAEAKVGHDMTVDRARQLQDLVKYVFEDRPEQAGKRYQVRRDILPRRAQFIRWVAEGKSTTTFESLSHALKTAYMSPQAYQEACRLLCI